MFYDRLSRVLAVAVCLAATSGLVAAANTHDLGNENRP
jgi:hypothetical protein